MNIKFALLGLLASGLLVAGINAQDGDGGGDADMAPPPGGNPVAITCTVPITPTGAEVIRETTVELEAEAEEPAGVDADELAESVAYLRSYGLTGSINIRGTVTPF